MRTLPLSVGFMPLVDAAPLIIARELGFAEEEGLALNLQSAPSWSTLRERLILGQIEAAHMLSPVPVAMALGLGGLPTQLDALSVLSINGNVIGISNALADEIASLGATPDFLDAQSAGQALPALHLYLIPTCRRRPRDHRLLTGSTEQYKPTKSRVH